MKAYPLPSEIRRTGNISANGSSFPIRVRDRARAAPGALHDSHTTGGRGTGMPLVGQRRPALPRTDYISRPRALTIAHAAERSWSLSAVVAASA